MTSDERRSETRLDEKTTVFVEICAAEPGHNPDPKVIICTSLDLSANGLQVQMDSEVPVSSILRLCADFGRDKEPVYLIGEAKWVRPEGELFNVGFELFDAENSDIIAWKNLVANKLLD
jgi:hypothetical protein